MFSAHLCSLLLLVCYQNKNLFNYCASYQILTSIKRLLARRIVMLHVRLAYTTTSFEEIHGTVFVVNIEA